MAARQSGGVLLGAGGHQSPQARPRGKDVRPRDRTSQIALRVLDQVVHLRLARDRHARRLVDRHVGGADHDVAVPRNREEHPAVVGPGDQHRRAAGQEGAAHHDVRAPAQHHGRVPARFVHPTDRIGERTRRVHHHRAANLPLRAAEQVSHAHPLHRPARLHQPGHLRVVERDAAEAYRGPQHRPSKARVVELAVAEEHTATQPPVRQRGDSVEAVAAAQQAGRPQAPSPCQGVVELQSDAEVRPLPPAVRRHNEGEVVHQVGGVPQQTVPFSQRAVHEADFALTQVAHPSMDQLGAAAGGPSGEVAALEEQRPVAAGRRVEGGRESRAATSDHHHVPRAQLRGPVEHVVSGEDIHLGMQGRRCVWG